MGRRQGQQNWASLIADEIPDLVCLCVDTVICYMNPAGLAILARDEDSPILGLPVAEIIHPDYRPILDHGLDVLVADGNLPMMFVRPDGSVLEMEVRISRLDNLPCSFGPDGKTPFSSVSTSVYMIHGRDIGDRMAAVQEILLSEQRYRSLVNLALDAICLVDRTGLITLVNKAAKALLKVEGDTLKGRSLVDVIHADYRQVVDLGLDVLSAETDLIPLKLITSEGEPVEVEARIIALGRDGSFMVEARDIRPRLRSAEAVREREHRLQGILDAVAEGIVTADDHAIIQSFNRAAERIFGYQADEVIGQNLKILMPEPHFSAHDAYMTAFRKESVAQHSSIFGRGRELEGRRRDGTCFPLELNVTEVWLGDTRLLTGIIRDITDRKRAEQVELRYKENLEQTVEERTRDLRRLSLQNKRILDSAGDGIVGLNNDGQVIFANPAAAAMLGFKAGDLIGRAGEEVFRIGTGARRGRGIPVRAALRRGIFNERTELTLMTRQGAVFDAEYASSPIEDKGERTGAVVVFRDITERKAVEDRLKIAGTVFDTTVEGILVIDKDGAILMANAASGRITGWNPEQALRHHVKDVLFPGNEPVFDDMLGALDVRGACELEFWSFRQGGEEYAARLVASVVPDDKHSSRRVVIVVNDISQRKRDEERIRFQANYDMLTGLPNRTLFHDRLEQALTASKRHGAKVALMFIDLDGFKAINDTLGHDAGDLLLKDVAGRLRKCVRESDTVARLGGDEFTIIMTRVDGRDGIAQVARRILASLAVPFQLLGNDGKAATGQVSASIGISISPDHATQLEDLLRNADAAMYQAKNCGKANFVFFSAPGHPDRA